MTTDKKYSGNLKRPKRSISNVAQIDVEEILSAVGVKLDRTSPPVFTESVFRNTQAESVSIATTTSQKTAGESPLVGAVPEVAIPEAVVSEVIVTEPTLPNEVVSEKIKVELPEDPKMDELQLPVELLKELLEPEDDEPIEIEDVIVDVEEVEEVEVAFAEIETAQVPTEDVEAEKVETGQIETEKIQSWEITPPLGDPIIFGPPMYVAPEQAVALTVVEEIVDELVMPPEDSTSRVVDDLPEFTYDEKDRKWTRTSDGRRFDENYRQVGVFGQVDPSEKLREFVEGKKSDNALVPSQEKPKERTPMFASSNPQISNVPPRKSPEFVSGANFTMKPMRKPFGQIVKGFFSRNGKKSDVELKETLVLPEDFNGVPLMPNSEAPNSQASTPPKIEDFGPER